MAVATDRGLFGPESVTWRLTREQITLLGGGRALLLQLAHPMVAAGVAQYSDFQADPLKRLRRTLDATLAIVFGTTRQADKAAAQIRAVHDRVRGVLTEDVGRFTAGTPFEANDPSLLMWVQATLIDTAILVYQTFTGPVSDADLNRYYDESRTIALKLGVPDETLPATLADFRRYFDAMLASDEIAVGSVGRELGRAVLAPTIRHVPGVLFRPAAVLTAGLLPPSVRDLYGLPWSPARERAFRAEVRLARLANKALPARIRLYPQARAALKRIAAGAG
jgi:uncharacterized protein (DUF2236 family)